MVRNLTCSRRQHVASVSTLPLESLAAGHGARAHLWRRHGIFFGQEELEFVHAACGRRSERVAHLGASTRRCASSARVRAFIRRLRRPQHQDLEIAHVVLRRRSAYAGDCGAQHLGSQHSASRHQGARKAQQAPRRRWGAHAALAPHAQRGRREAARESQGASVECAPSARPAAAELRAQSAAAGAAAAGYARAPGSLSRR